MQEPIQDLLSIEDIEAKAAGFESLEKVPHSPMDGERVLCNVCATSIPNLHFTCNDCKWDLCVQCAMANRIKVIENVESGSPSRFVGSVGQSMCCMNKVRHESEGDLTAKRFMDDEIISILRKIASEVKLDDVAPSSSAAASPGAPRGLYDWSQAISSSLKSSIAPSSLSAANPLPVPTDEETALLASKHLAMRRDSLDPEVREDGRVRLWGHWLRLQDVRRATWAQPNSSDGSSLSISREDEFVFSPHVSSLDYQSPDFTLCLQVFFERWQARQPVIVRGVKSRMQWGPEVMLRAAREMGNKKHEAEKELSVQVLDCRGFVLTEMTQHAFFQHYMTNCDVDERGHPRMLKVSETAVPSYPWLDVHADLDDV